MPLNFGNPALLFGAFAAALPVIIHFLSRRRVRRLPFSDLRFLDEVQARQARSLGVRRWLLLLLRVLAVLLVALAAAAPRWGGLAAGDQRSVLFVLDTSASMATQTGEGTRLDIALGDCRRMIEVLPSGAAVQVITAGAETRALFAEWLPAGAGAARALAEIGPSAGAFDLPAVLRLAARQVARAPGVDVELIVLGDLQAGAPATGLAEAAARLAAAGAVRVLARGVGEAADGGGVMAVRLPRRTVLEGETIVVGAEVRAAHADQVFTLELDGRAVAEAVAAGPAGRPETLEFALAVPGPGLHRGAVRKESDAFAADDARPFVLAVPAAIPVLLGHGTDRAVDDATGRGGWRILAEALAPGGDTALFRLRPEVSSRLTTGAVAAAGLTVLVDPDRLGRQALQAIVADVAAGGGLLVLAGDPVVAGYVGETLLPALGRAPGAEFVAAAGSGQRARVLDRGHQVFAGLPDEAVTTLEDVTWRRWLRLDGAGAQVPLALAGDDPLLLAASLEAGRWAVLPFNLKPEASDLPGSPMALPLLRRLCTWLARPAELAASANLTVGDRLRLQPLRPRGAATLEDAAGLRVAGPGPDQRRQAALDWQGALPWLDGGPATTAGFAVFLAGGDTVGLAAVGLPAAESTPELLTAAAWSVPLAAAGLQAGDQLDGIDAAGIMAVFGGRNLAPWLLAAAIILLAVELRLGRGAAAA